METIFIPEQPDWKDEAGFAELFEAGHKVKYDKGEKEFGSPDKEKQKGERIPFPKTYQARLDLHGKYIREVEPEVRRFVSESRQRNLAFLLIIAGMGRHSEGGESKLRPLVMQLLNKLKTEMQIKDFSIAAPKDGGYGAIYVYLR